ncbi:MAG: threonine/serine dehydratase [Proteobacteria bacterium]|nr:threonine/serine dehydratase [Pseudomonadota bacterium]MDA1357139.1 threonine/serine dehydratase [Pseudomonadota bacterium]
MVAALTLAAIEAAAARIKGKVVATPIHHWHGPQLNNILGVDTEVILKLELFQHTGTFKARGALVNLLSLSDEQLAKGVTAVSAGNHAIAAAFAAQSSGASAKVVMMKSANPFRVSQCRAYGAEVIFAEDVHQAFDTVKQIEKAEERTFVHPFEGELTALGTATLGLEFARQAPQLDTLIVPIGGGGLCAGVASAFKLVQPACQIYGVEPEGADSMSRSFRAGSPQTIDKVRTIADSLGAPYALPYSFALCQQTVDEIVLIDDDAMRRAMGLLFSEMKLAVEPAGAAATAALLGPLRERLQGKRVGVIVCGANIDFASFAAHALFETA